MSFEERERYLPVRCFIIVNVELSLSAMFKCNCFGKMFSFVLQQPAQLSVGPTPTTRPATPSPHPTVSSRLGSGEDMPSITRFMDMRGWLNGQAVQPWVFDIQILKKIVS